MLFNSQFLLFEQFIICIYIVKDSQNAEEGAKKLFDKFQKDLEVAENDKTGYTLFNLLYSYLGLPDNKSTNQGEVSESSKKNKINQTDQFFGVFSKIFIIFCKKFDWVCDLQNF